MIPPIKTTTTKTETLTLTREEIHTYLSTILPESDASAATVEIDWVVNCDTSVVVSATITRTTTVSQ